MTSPPEAITLLFGTRANGTTSATLVPCRVLGGVVTRSMGLAGDDLTVIVKSDDWPPGDWDLTKPIGIQFGDTDATIDLGGYLLRATTPVAFGAPLESANLTATGVGTVKQEISLRLTTLPGAWRDGRGGLIADRTRNRLNADGLVDIDDDDYQVNSELVTTCLDAIGLSYGVLPATLDDFDPPGPLDWGNTRAIAELEAVLARIGHTVVFNNDGVTMDVVRLPLAGETIGLDSAITDNAEPYELMTAPAAKATKLVVTSGRTRTIIATTRFMSDLEWVWFDDRTGRWLNDSETETEYPGEVKPGDISRWRSAPSTDPELRRQEARLFSAVRLTGDDLAKARRIRSASRQVTLEDGVALAGAMAIVRARGVEVLENGQFRNAPESDSVFNVVDGVRPSIDQGVFVLPTNIEFVRMNPGPVGTAGNADALADDDLRIDFFFEANTGDFQTDYFVRGWEASESGGSVVLTEMTGATLTAALADPDTVVVEAPWLQRVMHEDSVGTLTELNDTELEALALQVAEIRASAPLAVSGLIECRGWLGIEPGSSGGAISAVTWELNQCLTIVQVNSHEVPDALLEAIEVDAGRSFVSGLNRYAAPGSSAALGDVRGGSTPGEGTVLAGAATRGREDAMGPPAPMPSGTPAPRRRLELMRRFGKITGATSIATNRWSYAWTEIRVDATGGNFAEATAPWTSATHGLAYNLIEASNTGTGVEGNGVNRDNLPATFSMQPIATGAIVELIGPFGQDGAEHWLFAAVNSDDGACPSATASAGVAFPASMIDSIMVDADGNVMCDGYGNVLLDVDANEFDGADLAELNALLFDGDGTLMSDGDGNVMCSASGSSALAALLSTIMTDADGAAVADEDGNLMLQEAA